MKDDIKATNQLVHELTELHPQNAAPEKPITGIISAELIAEELSRYAVDIVKMVREPILVLDAAMNVITANKSFYSTFDVTHRETIGRLIYDLGNRQWDIPKLRDLLSEVLPERGGFDNLEVVHNFQGIGQKIMLLNAHQIYRKDIGINMIILAIKDITERRRREDLLTDSEERFRRLFETASDGIVLLEKCGGKITHANPATEKILGYSNEELLGNSLQEIGVILEMGDFQTTIRNLDKSGILYYNDVSVQTKAGRYVYTDIYLVDKATLVQCNIRDITERKRAEYELVESEKHYRMLFDAKLKSEEKFHSYIECAPDGVFIVDDTGRYFEANKSACRIIGYSIEEIVKMSIRDLLADESLEDGLAHFSRLMETGAAISDLWHKHKDGSKRCLTISAVKLSETQVLGFCKDITQRRQAEAEISRLNAELEQRVIERTTQLEIVNKELKSFTYTVAHDLKAPLRAVEGYAQILIEDHAVRLDSEGRRTCEVIRDNVRKMNQLIDALLTLSGMGRIEMNPEPINMATIANAVFFELTTSEDRERIDFSVSLLPPAVGDPTLLRQVWTNLLGNAVKFSAKKEPAVIEVGCLYEGIGPSPANGHEADASKAHLPSATPIPDSANVYFVRDNGAGFNMAYVGNLFGVFQRLHSAKEFEGTGVGLAIVQRIVQRHGGRIWAEGEPGKGATFYFSIGKA